MNTWQLLMQGFVTVLQPANLTFAVIGCVLGMVVGVLPGVGPAAGTAVLIPVTMSMSPTAAIIMLAAIYYGAMYGGTITSVLLNMPGEASSAVTCLDGYEMAKRGRAGPALAIAAIGSFVGGTLATVGLVAVAVPMSRLALSFGPPEFFALMIVGLSLVMGLASQSLVRALIAAILGLLMAQVGIDPVMGAPRFAFGEVALLDGLGIVPVVMGLFGIGEILLNVESKAKQVFVTDKRRLTTRLGAQSDLSRSPDRPNIVHHLIDDLVEIEGSHLQRPCVGVGHREHEHVVDHFGQPLRLTRHQRERFPVFGHRPIRLTQ